jgi:hypothetical protein
MDDRLALRLFVLGQMIEPEWANVSYTKPDFQAISYYSAPKQSTLIKH